MAAQLSPHDELVGQLRAHVPAVQGIADRAYAMALASTSGVGTRRELERVGRCAVDLAAALSSLKVD